MTRVSKRKLKKEVRKSIDDKFVKTLSSLGGGGAVQFFLNELFTPTERTMFTKRLVALLMLAQGISPYRVWKLLKMSPQTTARMSTDMDAGRYPEIMALVKKKKDRERLWADLEVIIRFGMPEMGKNRWKWLNKI